jgi:ubiquinone/menaquinone biosynthesis C-methylase UbiE
MKNNNIFDNYAKIWNSYSFVQENAKNFAKYLNENNILNKDLITMDFGCGTGILGLKIINNVKKLIFLDSSKEMIKQVKSGLLEKNVLNYELIEGEIDTYKGDKIDLILVTNVLNYIDDINNVINKFSNILKKGGKVLVVDLIETSEDISNTHNGFKPENVVKLFENNGFNNVKYENFYDLNIWKSYKQFIVIAEL